MAVQQEKQPQPCRSCWCPCPCLQPTAEELEAAKEELVQEIVQKVLEVGTSRDSKGAQPQ